MRSITVRAAGVSSDCELSCTVLVGDLPHVALETVGERMSKVLMPQLDSFAGERLHLFMMNRGSQALAH